MKPRKKLIRNHILLVCKVVITLSLCAFIIWNVEWLKIKSTFQAANPFLLIIVFFCMIFGVTISAVKWKLILAIHGIDITFSKLHRYYFTSLFFNNFLPSSIGGDSYRILRTIDNPKSKTGAVIAIIVERVSGIWALLVVGFIGGVLVFFQEKNALPGLTTILCVLGSCLVGSLIFILVSKQVTPIILTSNRIPKRIKIALEHLDEYRSQPKKTLCVICISFFFHFFSLFWMSILVKSIGPAMPIVKIALAVTVSNLAAVLPVSINGIGVMDGSFIYIMKNLGMGYEHALMVMLLVRAFLIPLSLIGGFFYLKDKQIIENFTHSTAIHQTQEEKN